MPSYKIALSGEQSPNYLFHYFLGFQPSTGVMLIEESGEQITISVLLDARYTGIDPVYGSDELQQRINKQVTIQIILRTKKLSEHLEEFIPQGSLISVLSPLLTTQMKQLESIEGYDRQHTDQSPYETTRMIKTPYELQQINQAIERTNTLRDRFEETQLPTIVGMSELAVRGAVINHAFSLGLENEAFPTIVASGANSAIPHHKTSTALIEDGPLLVDMGRVFNGYCSDTSRSYRLGAKSGILYQNRQDASDLVTSALDKAVNTLKSTRTTTTDLDQLVRDYFADHNCDKHFTHALGHGVGIEVHEQPWFSKTTTTTLEAGMVLAVEPGLYYDGQFGIRWEKTVVIEK